MKKLLTITLLLPMFWAFAEQDDQKTVASELKTVTVFQQGAQEYRNIKASLPAGLTTLVVKNLSPNIDNQSIQVGGKGDIIIKSVQHQINYLNQQAKPKDMITMEDSIESIQLTLEKTAAKRDALVEQQNMILQNKSIGGQQTGVKAIELEDVADFVVERLTSIKTELVDIRVKEKKLNEIKNKLQNQLNELYNKRNRSTSEVLILVQAKTATNVDLDMNFYVSGAGWSPVYDIRATEGKNTVQMSMRANVFQNTGIEWKNVKLTLSTGNPSLGGNKPNLSPMYVNIYVPQLYQQTRSNAKMKYAEAAPTMAAGAASEDMKLEEVAETAANYVQVQENSLRLDYKVDMAYTIESTGKPQMVDVQNYDVKATFKLFATPKLDPDAFLVAQLTEWESYNLMPAEAKVYYDGSYVGDSYIDPMNTEDTLNISLGRDKRVVVKRDKVKDKTSKKLIGTNKTDTYAYEISVRNTRKDAIELILDDQIPVSQTSEIVVEMTENSGADYRVHDGKLTWRMKLEPAASKSVKFGFTVKYPKDKRITGL